MASDLISRSALLAECDRVYVGEPGGARTLIAEAQAVDAVEVVRCKDCVHAGAFTNNYAARRFAGGMNCYLCRGDDSFGMANVSLVYPDDYCSDGVRKEKQDAQV